MINAGELLDLLGNRTRRKILLLLAERPRFVSEIAEILNVRRKAIIEHLNLMESYGIIRSTLKRVEKGRPRKYYEINREVFVKVIITKDNVTINGVRERGPSDFVKKMENEIIKAEELRSEDRRVLLSYTISKIESRIRELESEWMHLQRLLDRARRLINL